MYVYLYIQYIVKQSELQNICTFLQKREKVNENKITFINGRNQKFQELYSNMEKEEIIQVFKYK